MPVCRATRSLALSALAFSTLALSTLALAACASDNPDQGRPQRLAEREHRGEGGPGHGGRPTLFVSPCGEPFRARPGEPYPVAVWFHQADADHDGQLDRAEFVADATRFFRTLDRNADGVIDGTELSVYEHQVVPEISGAARPESDAALTGGARLWLVSGLVLIQGPGGMGGGMGGGGRHGGRGGGSSPSQSGDKAGMDDGLAGVAPYNLLAEPEPVAASDLSFTGRISLADFKTRASQRFDLLDPDGRGYLTLDSLPKTLAQQRMGPNRGGRHPPPSPQA